MRFDPQTLPFLAGRRFSNGLRVQVASRERSVPDRFAVLEAMAREKRVLHIGFADHPPLLARKRATGRWLHDRLTSVAAECWGIDTNAEAVEGARSAGIPNVFCIDLVGEDTHQAIVSRQWDLAVLGEILEHVDDPTRFLSDLRRKYGSVISELVITVPNAFSFDNFRHALQHHEVINTDHRYWFTPYTLAKICTRAGWAVGPFSFCEPLPGTTGYRERLLAFAPALRETLVLSVRPGPDLG